MTRDELVIGPDGNRDVLPCDDGTGTPICPRQHLTQAAEQALLMEEGPCLCASCTACRAREMEPFGHK